MITVISSTNRKDSLTEKLSNHYSNSLKSKNIESKIIKLLELPKDSLFSILYENNNKNIYFNKIKNNIKDSEKVLFIIPEYNGSFPGVLKVFIDGLSYPAELKDKKCALIGISSGQLGCTLGLSHFTDILHYLGANVFPSKLIFSKIKDTDLNHIIDNQININRLNKHLEQFIEF